MLKKWNIWNNNLLVNMSDLSDKELLKLKDSAEREINNLVINKRQEIGQFFMEFGLKLTLKRLLYCVLRRIWYKMDNLSRSLQIAEVHERQWQEILRGE